MGVASPICLEEGRKPSFLRQQLMIERRDFSKQLLISCMDECIDSLGKATIFSTLHANSGYLRIEMDKINKAKTTFVAKNE